MSQPQESVWGEDNCVLNAAQQFTSKTMTVDSPMYLDSLCSWQPSDQPSLQHMIARQFPVDSLTTISTSSLRHKSFYKNIPVSKLKGA